MSLLRSLLALESAVPDGKSKQELELVFYARLINPEALSALAVRSESQEQYAYRSDKGTIRMRAVTFKRGDYESTEDTYILTTKVWDGKSFGKRETEVTSSLGMFEDFKLLFPTGMYKRRYVLPFAFETTPLVYEVDVFFTEDGQVQPWVKIDLELPEHLVSRRHEFGLPTNLQYGETVVTQFGERTNEEEVKIKQLYSEFFSTIPSSKPTF